MTDLAAEAKQINEHLWRMLWKGGDFASEVPLAIHSHDTDAGGAPELHPRLISYLIAGGACFCPEFDVDGNPRPHVCDRRFTADRPAGFRESRHQLHPRRLKRALRQLKLIAPLEFNAVYLMVARGRTWHQALAEVNDSRLRRGEDALSEADFVVLTLCGCDKLVECF